MRTHSPVFDAITRGEDVIFVDGKGDTGLRQKIQLQLSNQAVNVAIRAGTGNGVKQFLTAPKNRPYYRQFAKEKF